MMFSAWLLLAASVHARLWSAKNCEPDASSASMLSQPDPFVPANLEGCSPNPGFGGNVSYDFDGTSGKPDLESFWVLDPKSREDWLTIDLETEQKGAALKVVEPLRGPTLTSKKYLMFGRVDVELQAARGKGVITAIVLKSDSGNEIDWEILGAFEKQAQTNYFFDGRPLYNKYADTYDLDFTPTTDFHTYSVEWSDKLLTFSIDGKELKTWRNGDIPGKEWPQLPMQVKIGVWAVTEESQTGEIEWAGGLPDWEHDAPFVAYYRNLKIRDDAAWCHKKTGEITYDWARGAQWEDVKLTGCERRKSSGFTPDGEGQSTGSAESEPSRAPSSVSERSGSPTTEPSESWTTGTVRPSDKDNHPEEDIAVTMRARNLGLMILILAIAL